jgi:hypothetical protein
VPLPASVLLALAALASSVLWAEELRKLAGRVRVKKVAAEANPA